MDIKTALVLEGGGLRGLFTCGVLDFFLTKNINFDVVLGVSAGSGAACSYLSKQFGRGAAINLDYLHDKRYLSLSNLLKTGNAFGFDFVFSTVSDELNPFDYNTFSQNRTDFYSVSTEVETGKPLYKRVCDMHKESDYVIASMSLPLISKIVHIDGHHLLDGGISDSIPIAFAKQLGCDKIVVVLTQCPEYRKGKNNLMPIISYNYKMYPNLIHALKHRHIQYNHTLNQIREMVKKQEAFVIQPQKPVTISRLETNRKKLELLYQEGFEQASQSYEQMNRFIK